MTIPKPFEAQVQARQRTFPVNVLALAKDLEIDVFESDRMTRNQSGILGLGEDGKPFIIVNRKHPATRQMFTIAHEIGHFMAHQDALKKQQIPMAGITRVLKRENGRDMTPEERTLEVEANELAAEILMPEGEFKKTWLENENKEDVLDVVAEKFGVSTGAANVRAARILGEYAV